LNYPELSEASTALMREIFVDALGAENLTCSNYDDWRSAAP